MKLILLFTLNIFKCFIWIYVLFILLYLYYIIPILINKNALNVQKTKSFFFNILYQINFVSGTKSSLQIFKILHLYQKIVHTKYEDYSLLSLLLPMKILKNFWILGKKTHYDGYATTRLLKIKNFLISKVD
jgi:hypothetical protein